MQLHSKFDSQWRPGLETLSWVIARAAMVLVDLETGIIVDGNPAAEALTGYSRRELSGIERAFLHPEHLRSRLDAVYETGDGQQSTGGGIQIQRKEGSLVNVAISAMSTFEMNGRMMAIYQMEDLTDREVFEHRYLNQNWALAAYSGSAAVFGEARFSNELFQKICDAIARQSIYSLAWIAVAGDSEGKPIGTAAAAGSALAYLDALSLSWSDADPRGAGPLGVSLRTNAVQVMHDSEALSIFTPWRERARKAGIRSAVTVPMLTATGARGALVVYSPRTQAFDPLTIEVFQSLARQISRSVQGFDGQEALNDDPASLERTQAQLAEALAAISASMAAGMNLFGPNEDGLIN